MEHSAAFTPGIGIRTKVSIKYIINLLLYRESGKAANIFPQVMRSCLHTCPIGMQKGPYLTLEASPTGDTFVHRVHKFQAATTGKVFKRPRICCSKHPLFSAITWNTTILFVRKQGKRNHFCFSAREGRKCLKISVVA